jgi:predicted membrane channel-forming protein YqfA (hemolysin III family)
MHEHQKLLRRIVILGVGILIAGALIGFDVVATESAPGVPFYLGLVLLAVLGFLTAGWLFTSVESLTNSVVSEFPPFWLLIYLFVTAAMIVLLPVALVILIVRYFMARHRFLQDASSKPAGNTGSHS